MPRGLARGTALYSPCSLCSLFYTGRVNRLPDDATLLAECDVDTYRASGPGGQKRNKTESAVRLRHRPTGIIVIAEESRSQAENRVRGLKRMREALALRLRQPLSEEGAPAAASVLDVLVLLRGSVADTAARLSVTTGNLSSFLTGDDDLMTEANRIRAGFGLKALRRD